MSETKNNPAPDPAGLCYGPVDGRMVSYEADEQWLVVMLPEGSIVLRRFCGGRLDEIYAPMPRDLAGQALLAVLNGYQPERHPRRLDIPFDRIPPDSASVPVV